jgi:PP-loop superfamily ATP-utilizing enzyme
MGYLFVSTQLDKQEDQIESNNHAKPVIYNGTNADDKLDPTRLGLIAASEFQVVSPLETLTKQEVRDVSVI